ncbi:MAG: carbohydrate kinase family protein [Chloroflexota bacterium]|nr:carbohydrate kinase family protein [Chloroflexota bacterium]PLS79355.1 MAG: carbohydrate kinase [Chloroflexota bacterium]
MIDVLVLGELNADLILQGDVEPAWGQTEKLIDDATLTLGSSSAIFACGIARLGLSVAFAGIVGDDLLGHFCRDQLAARGIDTSGVVVDSGQRTGMTIILQRPDDRAMLTFPGAIAALTVQQVKPALLDAARHIHVGSYYLQTALQPGLAPLFAAQRRRGGTTSLDTNWDPSERWVGLDALLAATEIFLPNETEACRITGTADTSEALELLATRVPIVAIKRGAAGAVAARGIERVEAIPPRVNVVDAVGAGDSFDAGFVCGLLKGWTLERALKLAVACGALSTRAAGGTQGQATLDEAMALAEQCR